MPNLNTTQKFRLLHIANHAIAFLAVVLVIQSSAYWWFLLGLVAFLWTGIVGVNVALHRYYSHRAFKTSLFGERVLLISSIFTSLGSPAMWCSVHRLHHVTSDTDKDPHNPARGVLKTWFALWPMQRIPKRFVVPFLKSPDMKFVHKYYFALNWIVLIALCFISIPLAGFLYCLPAIGCFHGAAAIGVLPHKFGYRTYEVDDLSRNNVLAAVLSLGEGWHNNHHANPGRWWQGEEWWEIDPPAFMIKHFFMVNKDE